MKTKVLSILVDNTSGVLSRVSGLFSRRGYNIDSLTVGETEDGRYSRMTVVAKGDDQILEQIVRQLAKLEDVRDVVTLENGASVCRELVLLKLEADSRTRPDIHAIVNIFRANIVDVSTDSMMIELTGNKNKIDAFMNLLADYEIVEMVRTGIAGLARGTMESVEG